MEGREGQNSGAARPRYTLQPCRFLNEDILFCIDVDPESLVEMKVTGPNGRPVTRLDSIKQAILLFVNSKLSINSDHRFAFLALGKSTYWVGTPFFLQLSLYLDCLGFDFMWVSAKFSRFEIL